MARIRGGQRVVYRLSDALDGTELRDGEGESVQFALDGVTYEIDLSKQHADQLRLALKEYTAAGRRVGHQARTTESYTPPSAHELREWARANGFTVTDRGPLPLRVRAAHKSSVSKRASQDQRAQ